MAEPHEFFSIDIWGNMNPRIHHPAWYEAVKILSAEESQAATTAPLSCLPQYSYFQVAGLTVWCMEGQWEIRSQDQKNLDRMLDIAGRTFDTLKHTPMTAFGWFFQFLRPTVMTEVGKRLAEFVNGLPLGRNVTETDSAAIVTTSTMPYRVIHETISGVPEAPGYVRVAYHVQHLLRPREPEEMIFELTPLLRAAFHQDYPECLGRAEQLAKSLAGARKE